MSAYCEMPEFYNESFPKARKHHGCVECNAPIDPGEVHLYYRGKWDGEFGDGRQHMICRELCMLISKDNDGDCIGFGMLFDEESELFWRSEYGRKIGWDEKDRKRRDLMARIKWRHRKHRTLRQRTVLGLLNRKWGQPWTVVLE